MSNSIYSINLIVQNLLSVTENVNGSALKNIYTECITYLDSTYFQFPLNDFFNDV